MPFVLGCMGIDIALANEESAKVLASVDCAGVALAIEYSKEAVSFALDCIGCDNKPVALVCKNWGLLILDWTLVGFVFVIDV